MTQRAHSSLCDLTMLRKNDENKRAFSLLPFQRWDTIQMHLLVEFSFGFSLGLEFPLWVLDAAPGCGRQLQQRHGQQLALQLLRNSKLFIHSRRPAVCCRKPTSPMIESTKFSMERRTTSYSRSRRKAKRLRFTSLPKTE